VVSHGFGLAGEVAAALFEVGDRLPRDPDHVSDRGEPAAVLTGRAQSSFA
jgi:hypothetical protein